MLLRGVHAQLLEHKDWFADYTHVQFGEPDDLHHVTATENKEDAVVVALLRRECNESELPGNPF